VSFGGISFGAEGLHRLNVWSEIDPKSTTDGLTYCREPPFVPWTTDVSLIRAAVNDSRYTGRLICPVSLQHGHRAVRHPNVP